MLKLRIQRKKGRPRAGATAQCVALDPATRRHPARCPACAKARQRRLRAERRRKHQQGIALPPPRERTETAQQERRARANVAWYQRHGKIAPPTMCEACGSGRTPVYAWHPDPAKWQEVAWLCRPCRKLARATGGTIVLTWQWPGHTLGEIRTVTVVERPERRARHDRSAPSAPALPLAADTVIQRVPKPSDDEAALARLDAELAARFAEVEAINARVAGALAAGWDRQRDDEA